MGWPLRPNQYSGRYSSDWRFQMLISLKSALLVNGKM